MARDTVPREARDKKTRDDNGPERSPDPDIQLLQHLDSFLYREVDCTLGVRNCSCSLCKQRHVPVFNLANTFKLFVEHPVETVATRLHLAQPSFAAVNKPPRRSALQSDPSWVQVCNSSVPKMLLGLGKVSKPEQILNKG
jgi:hypothetical protein